MLTFQWNQLSVNGCDIILFSLNGLHYGKLEITSLDYC